MKIKILFPLLALLLANTAQGASLPLKKTHVFDDWVLYESLKGNKKECHAMSLPYRTRAFYGVKSQSWVALNFVAYNTFTVSAHSGFDIDHNAGLLINVDTGAKISLETLDNGQIWTYSSVQDAQLINALMHGNAYFTTRSYTVTGQTALDYYSLKGFNNIIKHMNKNC